VTLIEQGSKHVSFNYDSNMSRYYRKDQYTTQDEQSGRVNTETYYVGAFETIKTDNSLTHQYTIGNMLVREDVYTGKMTRKLMIRDHLGSVLATSELNDDNTQAFISQTFRYDPFGQQFALQESGFAAFTGYFRHGFTGHEMLNELNIIHMNGRIYDPTLGRFLQADPFIQAPTNSQSYNRYSYVLNNPLSYTDPSGYFFNKIVKRFQRAVIRGLSKVFGSNVVNFVGSMASAACGPAAPACAAYWTYEFNRAHGVPSSGALRSAAIAGFSAFAFQQVGKAFDGKGGAFWKTNGAGHIATHAVLGGVISELQGGKFGHGFFSAGLTKGINVNGMIGSFGAAYDAARIAVSAVIGGTISKITGGKFANGAVTAGFAQMLNGNSQIKGAANNPIGERFPGAAKVKMADGKYYWVDKQTYDRNFGSDYLAQQTETNLLDYNETTKQEVINAATGVATVTGFGGLALGSARLGYAAIGSGFFAWSLEPSAEGLGWLAVDAATMRMGPLLNGTLFEGLDHAVGSYSWLHQTTNAVQTCQVPLRCQ
jgi:RHS repeat-associated protein